MMPLLIGATEPDCASLPILADAISGSLAEVGRMLASVADTDTSHRDTATNGELARMLSDVHGALLMIDEQGLAALVQLWRIRLLDGPMDQRLARDDAARMAAGFASMMRGALDALLRGQRPVAGELLDGWHQLAGAASLQPGDEYSAAALVSLRRVDDTIPVMPSASDAAMHAAFEPSLLAFLRAQDDATRSEAALAIAAAIADAVSRAGASVAAPDERAQWFALRAFLIEFAHGNGDLARANRIVAASARAMRQIGQSGPALASLAREALFGLAQRERCTDAARDIARLYGLDTQFPPPGHERRSFMLPAAAANGLAEAVAIAIAAVEAEPDRLRDPSLWSGLSAAASDSTANHLAQALRRIATMLADAATDDGEWLAAALICIQGWLQRPTGRIDDDADLADALLEGDPLRRWQRMREVSDASSEHPLWLAWSSTLLAEMSAAEQAIDTSEVTAILPRSASDTLAQIAGALHLLDMNDARAAVLDLRAMLTAEPSPVIAADDAFTRQWVQLQQSFMLLPWRMRKPRLMRDLAASEYLAKSATKAGDSDLEAIFIEEARELLRSMRELMATAGESELIAVAHTLAGCSATVGLSAISTLAQAMEQGLARGLAADPALLADTLDAFDAMLAEFITGRRCDMASSLIEQWQIIDVAALDEVSDGVAAHCLAQEGLLQHADDSLIELSDTTVPEPVASIPEHLADDVHAASIMARTDTEADVQAEVQADGLTEAGVPETDASPVETLGMEPVPTPAPASSGDAPSDDMDELLAIFSEEAADLLPQLEQAIHAWQRQPDDREQPARLLRVLHTLKGSARMAGQHQLGEDFHRTEADIGTLSQLAPVVVAAQLPALLARVDGWLLSLVPASSGTTMPANDATPVPQSSRSTAPTMIPAPSLRVRADRLAQLADSGAEIWISNARLRESVQDQRRSVADLADDLSRLRAHLRELEIEADSRILSRAVQGSSSEFDPLEFDRYTRLHELTRMMAESITDIGSLHRGMARQLENLGTVASSQARDIRRQQSELQALRSQPWRSAEARLGHLLRQAARETAREAALVIEGGDVDIERGLLERLMGPLGHLLRNAIVHGIEPPDERERLGKPRAGRITALAALAGHELKIALHDDGRGLDMARIRARALAIGLLNAEASTAAPGEAPGNAQALASLIFEPGFSTASEVTALSGRGIGLDAVRAELQALGGRIDVDSDSGRGSRFTIRLPASLASVQVMLATAGRWRIALPATLLTQVLQLDPAHIKRGDDGRQIAWRGDAIRLLELGAALGDPARSEDDKRVPVAVLRDGQRMLAVQLDSIDGQRDVIVRHPGAQLAQVPGLTGATVLGDGSIALVIDPFRLPEIKLGHALPRPAETMPLVLVVDDSLTVRRASQRLLERHGYAVMLARDGIEALACLQRQRPVAVLLDIEMPRMDGFELLGTMRDDARFRSLPVVMITSRIADRHRERANLLGATAYLGKPYDEQALLALLSPLRVSEAVVVAA